MASDAMKMDDEVALTLGEAKKEMWCTCSLCCCELPQNELGSHWEKDCPYFHFKGKEIQEFRISE